MQELSQQYESAARQYREAIDAVTEPTQRIYARLLLARTLGKAAVVRKAALSTNGYWRLRPNSSMSTTYRWDSTPRARCSRALPNKTRQRNGFVWQVTRTTCSRRPPLHGARSCRETQSLGIGIEAGDLIRDREQAEALQRDLVRVISTPTESRACMGGLWQACMVGKHHAARR